MSCNEPHPTHTDLRCIATSTHADHIAYLGGPLHGEPIDWPNNDFVPYQPRARGAAANSAILKDLGGRVPKAKRSIDENVIAVGVDHPQTSQDMRTKVVGKTGTQRRRVYDFTLSRGEHGATDDETEVSLDMLHQSASSARNTLMKDGWLIDTGVRRQTRSGHDAIAWVAVLE